MSCGESGLERAVSAFPQRAGYLALPEVRTVCCVWADPPLVLLTPRQHVRSHLHSMDSPPSPVVQPVQTRPVRDELVLASSVVPTAR